MSHIGALKHAQIMGYENVIILEDDVVICEDWEKRLDLLLKMLPENWEYVYLAGHSDYVKLPMYEYPTVIKPPPMIGAFSYLVNTTGMQKLIDYCSEFITTYDDMIMHKIQKEKLNGYLYIPFMVYHAGKESIIWGETPGHIAHKNNMHSSYNYFKNIL
jgi:GR25 family glycosyltransferase involved in LPS biosynthesis